MGCAPPRQTSNAKELYHLDAKVVVRAGEGIAASPFLEHQRAVPLDRTAFSSLGLLLHPLAGVWTPTQGKLVVCKESHISECPSAFQSQTRGCL